MELTNEDKNNIIVALTYFIHTRESLGVANDDYLVGYEATLAKFEDCR